MKQPATTASTQIRAGTHATTVMPTGNYSSPPFWLGCAADQDSLDAEINKLRDDIKVKTARLCEMEGKTDKVSSFFLTPSKPSELLRTENL